MEDKIYYITGSRENPEGVKKALYDICPNAENIGDFFYNEVNRYYYAIDGIIDFAEDESHIELLKHIGTELQPKKTEKLTEKIMYSSVYDFDGNGVFEVGGQLFLTKEEALAEADSVGCQEIKILIK